MINHSLEEKLAYQPNFYPPLFKDYYLTKNYLLSSDVKKNINIRVMAKNDLEMVRGWAISEGWNPGKYETEALYAADPQGYRLLELNGIPIASICVVQHSQYFTFLGLYIVKPKFRGKGYGKLLWDAAIDTVKDSKCIVLNGVTSQIENYMKSGFIPHTLNTRWRGKPKKLLLDSIQTNAKIKISLLNNFSLTKIIDYDSNIFPTSRSSFLSKWLTMPNSYVFTAMTDNTLRGYGVLSSTEDGYKIAPLFADDIEIARKLFIALCQCASPKSFIYIDTNESNSFANTLATSFCFKKLFNTLQMYKGIPIQLNYEKIFGLTTLEIG